MDQYTIKHENQPTGNAPIALFVYNRPEHTRKTIEALKKNVLANQSQLFIFSDAPRDEASNKNVEEVRAYIKTVTGFKNIEIVERTENWGLSKSIIYGVTDIVNRFGKVIVMEDDLVSSPYFLKYMNTTLDMYENEDRVASIHGYVYPVKNKLPETFFLRGADCWGWATWARAWKVFEPNGAKLLAELESKKLIEEFDLDGAYPYSTMLKRQIEGKNDSWAIRWHASAFLDDKLTLYPGISLIDNIGQDKTGVHGTQGSMYRTTVSLRQIELGNIPVEESLIARKMIVDYFKSQRPSLARRLIRRIRKIL